MKGKAMKNQICNIFLIKLLHFLQIVPTFLMWGTKILATEKERMQNWQNLPKLSTGPVSTY